MASLQPSTTDRKSAKGSDGLTDGTPPSICDRPVSLLSLAPTLLQLCGLPPQRRYDGPSLVPLLADPGADWPHVALTHLARAGSFGLSDNRWRYIHYAGGGEELYDVQSDPYEWHNLAGKKEHQATLKRLRSLAPSEFVKFVPPRVQSLPALTWKPLAKGAMAPVSKPDGNTFEVVFINRSAREVELFWMDRDGGQKRYATIAAGKQQRQKTRPGAVWMIAAGDPQQPLGYFEVGDRSARAVVPK